MKYALGILLLFLGFNFAGQAQTEYTETLQPERTDVEEYLRCQGSNEEYQAHPILSPTVTWGAAKGTEYCGVTYGEARNAFRFDFASIPSNVEITSVKLKMWLRLQHYQSIPGSLELSIYDYPVEWMFHPDTTILPNQTKFDGVVQLNNHLKDVLLDFGPSGDDQEYVEVSFNVGPTNKDRIVERIEDALKSASKKMAIAFYLVSDPPYGAKWDVGISKTTDDDFNKGDLELEVKYKLVNVTYLNDFGRKDPTGPFNTDFRVTPPNSSPENRSHDQKEWWNESENWTLRMYDHANLEYSQIYEDPNADGRPYYREAKIWIRSDPSGDLPDNDTVSNSNDVWYDASIDDESETSAFTANFYRLVDNQFKAYALASPLGGSGYQITDNIIGIDEDRTNGPERYDYDPEVSQKRNSLTADNFYVEVPFYDNSGSSPLLFLGWYPDDNEASTMAATTIIDYGNNKVTTTVIPDLHHKDTYSNTYTAYYGQFKAMAIEHDAGDIDITSALVAATSGFEFTGFDAVNEALQVKVPAEYNDTQNGVKYVFAGWWDGTYGTLVDNDTKVSRHIMVNNYATSQARYDLVAMYKAHMNSGDFNKNTNLNSQRKIALDNQGRYHCVYESAGLIWYSVSTDVSTNQGVTWAPERKVNKSLEQSLTANGTYDGYCRRPAIAVAGEGDEDQVVITYVDENPTAGSGVYVVQPEWNLYDATYTSEVKTETGALQQTAGIPSGTSTPVIAINPYAASKVWMAIWNDGNHLKFSIKSVPDGQNYIAYDQDLIGSRSVDPLYPSIVWGSPELLYDEDYEFEITWLMGTNVRFARIGIDESGSSISIDNQTWTAASGAITIETVHASSSRYQIGMPKAIHAPSLTADNAPTWRDPPLAYPGRPLWSFSAYEIEEPTTTGGSGTTINVGTAWPASSYIVSPSRMYSTVPVGVRSTSLQTTTKPGRIRVNSRVAENRSTLLSAWNNYYEYRSTQSNGTPMHPCVGVKETPLWVSPNDPWYTKFEDVRTLFHDQYSQISVAKELPYGIQTPTRTYFHAEGLEPNQPSVSTTGTIRSFYTANSISNLLDNSLNTHQNAALQKSTVLTEDIEMRQLSYITDSSLALLGICNPRLASSSGSASAISWDPLVDSSGTEFNSPLVSRMRTESFDITGYDSLFYERELLSLYREYFDDQEFQIQLRDADDDAVLLTVPVRCRNIPEDSTYYELTAIGLSTIAVQDIYMTVDISEDMDSDDVTLTPIYAKLVVDEELQKQVRRIANPTEITLYNYPNPFNPSTDITYGIPEETHVKLAVYDNLGREVKVLANGWKAAGTYTVTFDASDLPSGMYLYRIETAKGSVSKKMMLMK